VRDVAVRLVDLADDAAVAAAEACLTPVEVARSRRGTPVVHRRRVLLRAALRAALAEHLRLDPRDVPLATTPAGRPHLALEGTRLDASCSASGGLGLVAVGLRCRVGIDVEAVTAWSDDVLGEGWLAPAEQRALAALAPADRPVPAARAWTQKEAVLKARGTGLRDDPAAVVTAVGRPDGAVAGWEVRDVPVPEGWVASLATGPEEELPS
jgi:4'-phosphopantetheinyl transferase